MKSVCAKDFEGEPHHRYPSIGKFAYHLLITRNDRSGYSFSTFAILVRSPACVKPMYGAIVLLIEIGQLMGTPFIAFIDGDRDDERAQPERDRHPTFGFERQSREREFYE